MQTGVPDFSVKDLFDAGVHLGHSISRWNPKMESYIYGIKGGTHIIDLRKSYFLLSRALRAVKEVANKGGKVLFVGTKQSSRQVIEEYVKLCGHHYVNYRWLGGTLTNWRTILRSIRKLDNLDKILLSEKGFQTYTKKELLKVEKKREKLQLSLSGIRDMKRLPNLLIVLDSVKDSIAISEANKLKIPVVAISDTNSDPDKVDYPVPGNDDSLRSIKLYLELFSRALLTASEEE
ncbi:30S ribosomal protein S2 [Candidatus Sneabacter namystus]|uniref:Small ribosomal subunit protein uS2 n=1 Tax=Candidatus Sneabacter namystus TaxID=2601646 RepID=A0A5C0UIE9_9RICK|nr:30S ribosomal protein S2 [Candidatus Sneabacter namystus]QEK39520.1 30S ribosomal protein S2 [Candidatus Sneabacter namystus]